MNDVERLVFEAFLAKGGSANTVKELLHFAGLRGIKIGAQRLRDSCNASMDVVPVEVQVARREKNYGTIAGYAPATAWRPSLRLLANEINQLRSAA